MRATLTPTNPPQTTPRAEASGRSLKVCPCIALDKFPSTAVLEGPQDASLNTTQKTVVRRLQAELIYFHLQAAGRTRKTGRVVQSNRDVRGRGTGVRNVRDAVNAGTRASQHDRSMMVFQLNLENQTGDAEGNGRKRKKMSR